MPIAEFWLRDHVESGFAALSKRELALDVGANVGSWTESLSKLFSSVVAFEPDVRASQQIQPSENVLVINAAVSDCEKRATLYLRPSPDQTSLLQEHPIGAGGGSPAPVVAEVEVTCVPLDLVAPFGADFVKMDIEGGEVLALKGCVNAEIWARTFFVVECHDTFADVSAELTRLGKRVTKVPHPLVSHPGHCWAIGE